MKPKRTGEKTARLSGRVSPELIDIIRSESERLHISQSDYIEMCIRNARRGGGYYLDTCKACGYSEPWDDCEFLATRYTLDESGFCPQCGKEWQARSPY